LLRARRRISVVSGDEEPQKDFWNVTLEPAREILVKVEDAERIRIIGWEQATLALR
jgi:hypothetical protein